MQPESKDYQFLQRRNEELGEFPDSPALEVIRGYNKQLLHRANSGELPLPDAILFWSALTILSSIFMKGYAQPGAIDALHRSMVVVPVVVGWIGFELGKTKLLQKIPEKLGTALFLLMAVMAIYKVNSFDRSIRFTNHRSLGLVKDILDFDVSEVNVWVPNVHMTVASHYLKYFRPNLLFYWEPGCGQRKQGRALIYTDNEACAPAGGVNLGKLVIGQPPDGTTLVRYLVEEL